MHAKNLSSKSVFTHSFNKTNIFFKEIVKNDELEPSLKKNDIVILSKLWDHKTLKNKIVLIKNPYDDTKRFSYVVGVDGEWIQPKNFNSFVQIPSGSIWNEPGIIESGNNKIMKAGFRSYSNYIVPKNDYQKDTKILLGL